MNILLSYPNWPSGSTYAGWKIEVVDGKQRLTAVLAFLADEISAFGRRRSEYEDKFPRLWPSFRFCFGNFTKRVDILKWYLDFNSGGTVHTSAELDRVKYLLQEAERHEEKRRNEKSGIILGHEKPSNQ